MVSASQHRVDTAQNPTSHVEEVANIHNAQAGLNHKFKF
jgi:hypothetical protein